MGFNIQRTGRVFMVAERCVRGGFFGEVWGRVGVEDGEGFLGRFAEELEHRRDRF